MMGTLIGAFATACVRVVRGEPVPDGMGGYTAPWISGAAFRAAITDKTSAPGTGAEKRTVAESYRVTTPKGVGLALDDVFRRVSDGATFRVTSNHNDTSPPACAGFSFEQVTAERWDIPT